MFFPKPTKYKNKKVEAYGYKFDSKLELEFYEHLLAIGAKDVIVHPRYILQEKYTTYTGETIKKIEYVLDFQYTHPSGAIIVVDTKGNPTEVAKIKRKLFMFRYPNLQLDWLVKFGGNWVNHFDNEKRKQENRKAKKKYI